MLRLGQAGPWGGWWSLGVWLLLSLASQIPESSEAQGQETPEAPAAQVLDLWPESLRGRLPGDPADWSLPPEGDTSAADAQRIAERPVVRLGNVAWPQLEIFRPAAGTESGAAVLICPGGGYHILAYDLEGTEVAQWLRSLGITAIVLKYRVPARPGPERWRVAVTDTQRALSLVRAHAQQWGVDAEKIGILGFSAGGHAAAVASSGLERQYDAVDEHDQVACHPDFSLLIYPGYLVAAGSRRLTPPLDQAQDFPPTFLVHAHDDPVPAIGSLTFATQLQKLEIPVELHLYAEGGHGYGIRPTSLPVTGWPAAAEAWLRRLDHIRPGSR